MAADFRGVEGVEVCVGGWVLKCIWQSVSSCILEADALPTPEFSLCSSLLPSVLSYELHPLGFPGLSALSS